MKKNLFLLTGLVSFGFSVNAQMGNFTIPVRMGSGINTDAEESMPVFSKDSSILYFSRVFDATNVGGIDDQDIWFSKSENGEYTSAENLKGLNNKNHNAVQGISQDGNSIYLLDSYEGKKDLVKGVALSTQKGSGWGNPVHVNVPTLDIEGDAYSFHVDETETIMIISYKGPGSLGEEDLYVSKNDGSSWSEPIHMGSVINTSGYEITPFLSKTKDTLFFASNGLGGEGDADIFYSVRQSESWTEWSTPTNLGPLVNSPKFDGYFTYNSNRAYWASNRESDKSDIYYANILPPPPMVLSSVVTDATAFGLKDGKIDLKIEGGKGPFSIIWSNGVNTEDVQDLAQGRYTAIITDANGQTAEITVEIGEPKEIVKPLVPREEIKVDPIYFDLAKFNIRKDASKELDKIVKIMNENPTIEIELASHTDCQASDEYNMLLSYKRAKSTAMYIRERITKPERINGKGYGESRLKVDCDCDGEAKQKCTEKDHKQNRRTEFFVRKESDPRFDDIATTPMPESSGTSNTTSEISSQGEKTSKLGELIGSKFKTDIPVTEEQKKNIENGFYIVSEGETLYRVHINTKVSTAELRRINNLTSNSIKPGTKLLLK